MNEATNVKDLIGIHNDISNSDYHSGAGISKSDLDKVHISPLHYFAYKNGEIEHKATPAMELGTLVHSFVLEPDTVDSLYVKAPEELGTRTKAYKEFCAEQEASGKKVVTPDHWNVAEAMRKAVYANATARELLSDGKAELSGYFKDKDTGLLCKIRPDFLKNDHSVIVDLKTTADASSRGFAYSAMNFRYFVQHAFYADGLAEIDGEAGLPRFVFIAVEKTPPYAVAIYELDTVAYMRGKAAYEQDLMKIAECSAFGSFPGYQPEEGIETLYLPFGRYSE